MNNTTEDVELRDEVEPVKLTQKNNLPQSMFNL